MVIDGPESEESDSNAHATGMFFVNIYCSDSLIQCIVTGDKERPSLGNPTVVDKDGLLVDVDVQPVDDIPATREDRRQDVDHFFRAAVIKDVKGKSKKYRPCKLCP